MVSSESLTTKSRKAVDPLDCKVPTLGKVLGAGSLIASGGDLAKNRLHSATWFCDEGTNARSSSERRRTPNRPFARCTHARRTLTLHARTHARRTHDTHNTHARTARKLHTHMIHAHAQHAQAHAHARTCTRTHTHTHARTTPHAHAHTHARMCAHTPAP